MGFPGPPGLGIGLVPGPAAVLLSIAGGERRVHRRQSGAAGPRHCRHSESRRCTHLLQPRTDSRLCQVGASSRAQTAATPDSNSAARPGPALSGVNPPSLGSPQPPSAAGPRRRSHAQARDPRGRPAWPHADPCSPTWPPKNLWFLKTPPPRPPIRPLPRRHDSASSNSTGFLSRGESSAGEPRPRRSL